LIAREVYKIFTIPIAYGLLLLLVVTAVLQIVFLNRALARFNATQVIPIQFVLFTISVIVGSSILYRDFSRASSSQITKFVVGCLLTFVGVYLITSQRSRRSVSKGTPRRRSQVSSNAGSLRRYNNEAGDAEDTPLVPQDHPHDDTENYGARLQYETTNDEDAQSQTIDSDDDEDDGNRENGLRIHAASRALLGYHIHSAVDKAIKRRKSLLMELPGDAQLRRSAFLKLPSTGVSSSAPS